MPSVPDFPPSCSPAQRAPRRRSVAAIGEPSLLHSIVPLLLPIQLRLASAISAYVLLMQRQLLHLTIVKL